MWENKEYNTYKTVTTQLNYNAMHKISAEQFIITAAMQSEVVQG